MIALAAGWLAATVLLAALVLVRSARLIDMLAVAAASALVAALAGGTGSDHALALLLAPLCCVAAGVLTFRAAGLVLRGAERVARGGPVLARLALVNLARSPGLPALAIAFVAVAVGLGGFALAYRSTLIRSAADQAADRVPLDALVSPGPDFSTPLELAPLQRWQALAAGAVLPIRRTDANYTSGGGTVTVPALGVPAAGLIQIHGWRESDGSAPLAALARRLEPAGPVRVPGPMLPAGARWLSLRASSPGLAVDVTADLRDPQGAIRQVAFGTAGAGAAFLRAPVPPGRWELEALELDEPTGVAITNGHQNGENPAAATQSQTRVALGPLLALPAHGPSLLRVPLGAWRGVGAAATACSRAERRRRDGRLRHERNTRRAPAGPARRHPPRPGARRSADGRLRRARWAHRPDGRRPPGDRARGRGPQPLPDASLRLGRLRRRRRGDARGGPGRAAPRSRPGRRAVDRNRAPGGAARRAGERGARPARLLVPRRHRASAAGRAGGARGARNADRGDGAVRGAGRRRVAGGAARRSPR